MNHAIELHTTPEMVEAALAAFGPDTNCMDAWIAETAQQGRLQGAGTGSTGDGRPPA